MRHQLAQSFRHGLAHVSLIAVLASELDRPGIMLHDPVLLSKNVAGTDAAWRVAGACVCPEQEPIRGRSCHWHLIQFPGNTRDKLTTHTCRALTRISSGSVFSLPYARRIKADNRNTQKSLKRQGDPRARIHFGERIEVFN